jgi:hypothetical protein
VNGGGAWWGLVISTVLWQLELTRHLLRLAFTRLSRAALGPQAYSNVYRLCATYR